MINEKALSERNRRKIERLHHEAIEKAQSLAAMLRAKYGAGRVILFGSAAGNGYMHEGSDIDMLVDGIANDDFLQAGFDASVAAMPFDVDIIPRERARKEIIAAAEERGLEL